MNKQSHQLFEWVVLGELDSAFKLARWLVGNDPDAEDVVQEAAFKALKALPNFKGQNGKGWFLAIVRNACMDRLKQTNRDRTNTMELEPNIVEARNANPEAALLREFEKEELWNAVDRLPANYREMIVLREFEELSYREMATTTGLPIGTVMSRLARAREHLHALLANPIREEPA